LPAAYRYGLYPGSYKAGLTGKTKHDFLNMKVADLIGNPVDYLDHDFVKNLSEEKNIELACTTALFAKKPNSVIN
jgi:hypothetical protein